MSSTVEFNRSMEKMKSSLKTISDMLSAGSLVNYHAKKDKEVNPWVIRPLFENDNCSVGIVNIRTASQIPCDEHIHPESKEYLIVTKGILLLNINGKDVRTVECGECAVIPAGTLHYSSPLTSDTEIAYVCVPKDVKIPAILKKE